MREIQAGVLDIQPLRFAVREQHSMNHHLLPTTRSKLLEADVDLARW